MSDTGSADSESSEQDRNAAWFEIMLPNETVLRILKFLDARSLAYASGVNTTWRDLALREKLWHNLCRRSGRITGEFTELECREFAAIHSWKRVYFWIQPAEDLRTFVTEKEFADAAGKVLRDARKRRYWHARGVELFPASVSLLQQYADYLIDRPDLNTWGRANKYYIRAMGMGKGEFERLRQRRKALRQERQRRQQLEEQRQAEEAAGGHAASVVDHAQEQPPVAELAVAEAELREAVDEARRQYICVIYRYVFFMANNYRRIDEADMHFRVLFELLPRNMWVIEQYAEFVSEYLSQHKLADRLYRMVVQLSASGSSLANYALFLWRVRGVFSLAERCFQLAAEVDPDRYYYYVNFMSRRRRASADSLYTKLNTSRLFKMVEERPDDDHRTFSLALAYHQIDKHEPSASAAESLYKKHLELAREKGAFSSRICTLSNLAELVLHWRLDFDTAEQLYAEGLELSGGANETIQMALAGLTLARGNLAEGLPALRSLLESTFMQAARNTHTEGLIMYFIYCPSTEKDAALREVKHALVVRRVRPKLILMFDAHIAFARDHDPENLPWIELLCSVYNCEQTADVLDAWVAWSDIEVPAQPEDKSGTGDDLRRLGLQDFDDE
eukprot:TRINITY_DN22898_c0_g1_i1.p1 TRINITY_DN22898_c0_g1~~TRINITY_DN22898_c0_g1_i1.p1  ORF type:complete len:619 (+),score=181.33 TRINITY_DN22898_c0_g1_i1:71-1927(+)